jgi:hypothetical protein
MLPYGTGGRVPYFLLLRVVRIIPACRQHLALGDDLAHKPREIDLAISLSTVRTLTIFEQLTALLF